MIRLADVGMPAYQSQRQVAEDVILFPRPEDSPLISLTRMLVHATNQTYFYDCANKQYQKMVKTTTSDSNSRRRRRRKAETSKNVLPWAVQVLNKMQSVGSLAKNSQEYQDILRRRARMFRATPTFTRRVQKVRKFRHQDLQ